MSRAMINPEWAEKMQNRIFCPHCHNQIIWPLLRGIISKACAEEREECAKICDERSKTWDGDPPDGQEREWGWMHDEAENCATAIRRRNEVKNV